MKPAFDENGRLLTLSERTGKKSKTPQTRPLEGSFTAQVLELLESEPYGMKAKQIAQVLGISQKSVEGAMNRLVMLDWVYGVYDGGHGKRYYALQRGE